MKRQSALDAKSHENFGLPTLLNSQSVKPCRISLHTIMISRLVTTMLYTRSFPFFGGTNMLSRLRAVKPWSAMQICRRNNQQKQSKAR
jgi:hypothetical protein